MKTYLKNQAIPLVLTVVTCAAMIGLLWAEVLLINTFAGEKILLQVRPADILVGLTIYLKTSIDFAIFIGRLMDKNPGLKGRIGIEVGTALGNAAGTLAILLLWAIFKEITWLLAIMIVIAALVLVRLAQDGLEHIDTKNQRYPMWFRQFVKSFDHILGSVNRVFDPFLSRILPGRGLKAETKTSLLALLSTAFTVPFILGLDDFAGYVPLFNVVNVFGFAIGVFIGHMILNIFLYLSPSRTIRAVKNPVISVLGSIAFIGLAIWGLSEAYHLIMH